MTNKDFVANIFNKVFPLTQLKLYIYIHTHTYILMPQKMNPNYNQSRKTLF